MSEGMGDAPPVGWIRVHQQGTALTRSFIPPTVRLNGYPVPTTYGAGVHPVAPGRWRVEASSQWLREYGQAALDVDVAAGQCVEVYYAAPWHQFTRGRMGTTPQPRPGGWALALTGAVLVVTLGVLFALIGVLGALT